jgi:O-antigen ligase/tetratricopeptide (TPR) repeat protein
MNRTATASQNSPSWARRRRHPRARADILLHLVDVGLASVIGVAPFFFGGRYDLGRLVLVALIGATATAWFVRRAISPNQSRGGAAPRWILFAAIGLVMIQLVPLPASWITAISPRTFELLPLWSPLGSAASLGIWNTISLTPHETVKSLAMLVSYCVLFQVVAERVQSTDDVRQLLRIVAVAAVVMALFGLAQFFTSDGRFFWFYEHPYRDPRLQLCGSFINRNHFASFLVLGVGPLGVWLWELSERPGDSTRRRSGRPLWHSHLARWLVGAALAIVICTVLRSLSRGGAMALITAATTLLAIGWLRGIVDRRSTYGLAALVGGIVAMLSVYGYDQVASRLDDFTDGSLEVLDQSAGRRRVWAANVAAIEAGWLTGSGAGTHAEICPVYLAESPPIEYTHAECGYLQVATENGVLGLALLSAGIAACGAWCIACLRRIEPPRDIGSFAACAAGLAASIVHSAIDFVWYIPACMSVAVVLAACMLRLAQLATATVGTNSMACRIARPGASRWGGAVGILFASVWSVHTFIGPGVAAVYWDRYLRGSMASRQAAEDNIRKRIGEQQSDAAPIEQHNERMLRQLAQVLAWDPQFARAQSRLAAAYINQFELQQASSANAMTLLQIQDAVVASAFESPAAVRNWLERAFGQNAALLYRADAAARRAVELCPLQGEAYVILGELSFLHGASPTYADACFAQALRVRPHDGGVLYEIGRQRFLSGQLAAALDLWQECFANEGSHQLKIVYLLAGRVPAEMLLARLSPRWNTLNEIWARYRLLGRPDDLEALIAYASTAARRETKGADGIRPMRIWQSLSRMYSKMDRPNESLACLERAFACNPRHFAVRQALSDALIDAGRFAEAESHVRWCLARRPEQKSLSAALVYITKQKLSARDAKERGVRRASFQRLN